MDREKFVAALVPAIAARTPFEVDLLASEMMARAWPGGHRDRHDAVALEWVRRWSPMTVEPAAVDCSCAQGRCFVCN